MERVTKATGAKVQTTINNLNPAVLGTCARFEERQVGAWDGVRAGLVNGLCCAACSQIGREANMAAWADELGAEILCQASASVRISEPHLVMGLSLHFPMDQLLRGGLCFLCHR